MRLAALFPKAAGATRENIVLYEKGYGKDAAGIAQEAVKFGMFCKSFVDLSTESSCVLAVANDEHYDVVLVDTAGRMQDNEPLMRALAKVFCFVLFF
jgi:signal recognition particle receptor subunit alpha